MQYQQDQTVPIDMQLSKLDKQSRKPCLQVEVIYRTCDEKTIRSFSEYLIEKT